MSEMYREGPVQDTIAENMQGIGHALKTLFPDLGFVLLVFPFGETPDARMSYLSNGRREDVLVAMKEFIALNEGRMHAPPAKPQ